MNKLRAVIVDDEKHSRETLKNLIDEFCDGIEVVAMAGGVQDAITSIKESKPDVLFLDIELQPGTGFDVLSELENINFDIIFTTAYEQYAVKAIKFSSLDYLLKPIAIDDLTAAVDKSRKRKGEKMYQQQLDILLSEIQHQKSDDRKICLATSDGIEFVKVSDILYCEAAGSYTTFIFKDGSKLMVSKHLKEYENLLADQSFMRVHNSFLINLSEVKRFVKSEGGYILMNNDAMISISPKKRDEFMERMLKMA